MGVGGSAVGHIVGCSLGTMTIPSGSAMQPFQCEHQIRSFAYNHERPDMLVYDP
jgi:hypothetical protein